jgi:polycystin 1L2
MSQFANIITECEADYSASTEEQQSFNPSWSSVYNSTIGSWTNYTSSITNAFLYNDSNQLDTYSYIGEHGTYGAGGYVYEFRGKMSEMLGNVSLLNELSWIDQYTRAVIIQMSLYNPNTNLFIFVTILAEFLPNGGVYPSARIEPLPLIISYQGKKQNNYQLNIFLLLRFCFIYINMFNYLHVFYYLFHAT